MVERSFRHPKLLHAALLGLFALLLAAPSAAEPPAAAPAMSQPTTREADPDARLLLPTQGRPAFVRPGQTLQVRALLSGGGPLEITLSARGPQPLHYRLDVPERAAATLARGGAINVTVPERTPPRTYDLELQAGATRLVARHCVAVTRREQPLRIVHLANFYIGDITAPALDERLIDEINLVAPNLIVLTGDYLDRMNPNVDAGWDALLNYLARFDAPTLMACGDHDDLAQYQRRVAPSPIGMIRVGPARGLVLFDHPSAPLKENPEQLRWIEQVLDAPAPDTVTFVVSHDEFPSLLDAWHDAGQLAQRVHDGRLGVWFSGGSRDWDGREYADLINAAAPLVYCRTHAASGTTRGGASGVPHYRVVDLVDGRAIQPHPNPRGGAPAPSLPVGQLTVHFDGPNDGTRRDLSFTVVNNHAFPLGDLCVRALLRGESGATPWCRGGRLEYVLDHGGVWEYAVRVDVPDRGAAYVEIGNGPPPQEPAYSVRINVPGELVFRPQTTPGGIAYLSGVDVLALLHVRNESERPIDLTPLVRLDGDTIAYRLFGQSGPFVTAYGLRIAPGQELPLQLDLSAVRATAGRRTLQVYVRDGAGWRLTSQPVDVTIVP